MVRSAPPSAAPRDDYKLVTSQATTLVGALRDVWATVLLALEPESPSLTILLFPDVPALAGWSAMNGLSCHLLSCRDCCEGFGRQLRSQVLHPQWEAPPGPSEVPEDIRKREAEARRAPVPAFTFSGRVGPAAIRPPGLEDDGDDDGSDAGGGGEDAELAAARAALDRNFAGASAEVSGEDSLPAPPPQSNEEVLRLTMGWFETHFARVHRAVGKRQRRLVLPGGSGEATYASFWYEAALLQAAPGGGGLAAQSPAAETGGQPDEPLSSLLVLPALGEANDFRNVLSSLTLGLAVLGLADDFALSAFHPKDTFQLNTAADGERKWETTLPHPLVHLVGKKRPAA